MANLIFPLGEGADRTREERVTPARAQDDEGKFRTAGIRRPAGRTHGEQRSDRLVHPAIARPRMPAG
ncbi:hypothetical protein Airi02_033340 [Actinoallomurus iriomotensis]|uniref:Uncharacterized protein n=1 Tax=Actinoallomurus iriomotensis TaxID=478107 RepID=A0A9W6S4U2_9ACTN|nr:hypothetical protein Airi02_033340 [Actinoallomurus iriomotensis]